MFRLAVAAAILAAFSLQAAEKEAAPVPPPLAVSTKASLYRGRTITIPLRAAGRTPGIVKFFIRSQPKHGTLGPVRRQSRTTATVTYTHDDSSSGEDLFTFAAQAEDSPVSAQGRVVISIAEEPAILELGGSLNFGEVVLGEASTRQITLRNAGGGRLEGQVAVPEPWRIEGPSKFRIGRGEAENVSIVFEPAEDRDYRGRLTFGGVVENSGELFGRGIPPLEFTPPHNLEFSKVEGSLDRAAELRLRNRTDLPRRVDFSGPPGLVIPQEIALEPGEEGVVIFRTVPGFLADLSGRITVRSEGYETRLPFRVFSSPPVFAALPGAKADFGEVEPGRRYQKSLLITNTGGTDARLRVISPAEVLVTPNPESIVLSPGGKRAFGIAFEPFKVGPYESVLRFEAPGAQPLDITITAKVLPQAKAPNLSTAKNLPIPSLPVEKSSQISSGSPGLAYELSIIRGVSLGKEAYHRALISWKKPKKKVQAYRIEGRNLSLGQDGKVRVEWETWQHILFREEGDRVVAEINNLPSGGAWFIRISVQEHGNKWSQPTPTFRIFTKRWKGPPLWTLFAALPALVAGVWVIADLIRRRREEAADVTERIGQLGKS